MNEGDDPEVDALCALLSGMGATDVRGAVEALIFLDALDVPAAFEASGIDDG